MGSFFGGSGLATGGGGTGAATGATFVGVNENALAFKLKPWLAVLAYGAGKGLAWVCDG